MTDSKRTVRELRIAAGLSPTELAAKSGVSYPTIVRVEAGAKPSLDNGQDIARALGVSVEQIAWGVKPSDEDTTQGKDARAAVA